jgi:sulfur carrier protein ThiS
VEIDVPFGTLLRRALREAGQAAEGSAVLEGETPVPLDEPLERSRRFTVVPTFSGG